MTVILSGKSMHEATKKTPGNTMPVGSPMCFLRRYLWMRSQKIDIQANV